MSVPELQKFYLVGGTALSLKYGHRKSIDLDLFSIEDFEISKLQKVLEKNFPTVSYKSDNDVFGIFCFIDDVKVDLIKHHYFEKIDEDDFRDGIRMFGDRDLCAMKIWAILKRGQKKDFWDLAELLKKYSLKEMIGWYEKKYPGRMLLISIPHAISYFEDADQSDDPVSLNNQTWADVKKFIQLKVREFMS